MFFLLLVLLIMLILGIPLIANDIDDIAVQKKNIEKLIPRIAAVMTVELLVIVRRMEMDSIDITVI